MRKFILIVLPFMLTMVGQLCSQPDVQVDSIGLANPWTNLDLNSSDDKFQFVIVTDRTGGHRPGVFENAVDKINLMQPEFVMSVGDLIEGYTEDTSILSAEWNEFVGFVEKLEAPFFYVPGNHDITNKVMELEYIKRFGRTYYHFLYKNVLFLCLNSEDQLRGAGRGTISETQYRYVESVLKQHPDVRHTLVFMHQPLWIQQDPKYWPAIESLLAERSHTVFAGHYHHYVYRQRNQGNYIMLATTGGGSRLRGPIYGEFDQIVWVTMADDKPVIANLWLKGIWDQDISTEETEKYIGNLFDNMVIQPEALFFEGEVREGPFRIRLNNKQETPITVHVQEGFGWDFWMQIEEDSVIVPPNDVGWMHGTFTVKKEMEKGVSARPTPLHFTVATELSKKGQIAIPMTMQYMPHIKKYISRQAGVIVDGNLDEYEIWDATFVTETGQEIPYAVRYDDDYVYLAARIDDALIVSDTSFSLSRQDLMGVAIAPALAGKSALAPSASDLIRMIPADSNSEGHLYVRDSSLKLIFNSITDENGYTFELAIPTTYLDSMQGGSWSNIRLNWTHHDLDHPIDWKETTRSWEHPTWGSTNEIVGSGIWFKE